MKEKENELNQNSENDSLKTGEQTLKNEIASDNEIKTEVADSKPKEAAKPKATVTVKKPVRKVPASTPKAIEQKEKVVLADVSKETEEIVSEDKNNSKSKKKKNKMKIWKMKWKRMIMFSNTQEKDTMKKI